MKLLRHLLLSLAVALIAAYTALWIALPDPLQSHVVTRPPFTHRAERRRSLAMG